MTSTVVKLHHVHDFVLTSDTPHDNPFGVSLSAMFGCDCDRKVEHLPGFFDGDGRWIVRFRPTCPGRWTGTTVSDDPALNGQTLGPIEAVANDNPAIHGQLGIDPRDGRRFAFEDAAAFVPLGFEFDWLGAFHQRLGQPMGQEVDPADDRFSTALDAIRAGGFNYVAANLYAIRSGFISYEGPWRFAPPDLAPFEGTPDQPDHDRLNVAFFRDFDQAVAKLHSRGIQLHLMIQVQNKKVKWPPRPSWQDDQFWRYVVARYQAYPNVIWDVSKESYILYKKMGNHDYVRSRMRLIRQLDAYRHLLTVHDSMQNRAARHSDVDLECDFVSDQIRFDPHTGHWDEAVRGAWRLHREAVRRFRLAGRPYMNIEYGYEEGQEFWPIVNGHAVASPETMLLWTAALAAGGAYATYYYNNTSWDLVKFEPIPPSWARYRDLMTFFARMDLAGMAPDREHSDRGMCLAQPGRQYYVLLPEGGSEALDLSAVPADTPCRVDWLDILTGQTATGQAVGGKFLTGLTNPLPFPTHPAAIYVKVLDGPTDDQAASGTGSP